MALSFKEKYSFGIGAFGKDIILAYVNVFLMIYFTDVLYLSPAFVGSLFFVARIWDAINDPVMGMIVDNTHNKFGKFRTWISIGTILNAIAFVGMFYSFGFEGKMLYTYISIVYIIYGMRLSVLDIRYWAWLPNLTDDPHEREQIGVIPRVFASSSYLIMGVVSFHLIYFLNNTFGAGDKNASLGYTLGAILIAIIYVTFIGITVVNVKETHNSTSNEKINLKHMWTILTQNEHLKSYIGLMLAYQLFNGGYGSFMIYYLKYVAGNQNLFSIYSACQLAEMVGLVLFPVVAKKLGRDTTYKIACLVPALGLVILGFSAIFMPASALLLATAMIMMKIGAGLIIGTITVLVADVIDYNQLKFGMRNESIICSAQTFLVKTSGAVCGLITGLSLTFLKYDPTLPQQSDLTINGLRLLVFIPSLIFILTSLFIYVKGYKLKGKVLYEVREKVAQLNSDNTTSSKETEERTEEVLLETINN